jgi:hypothetical protein
MPRFITVENKFLCFFHVILTLLHMFRRPEPEQFTARVLESRAAREASSRHRGEAAMTSQNPSPRVSGSKVRRTDTGGQTHSNERGTAKPMNVTGIRVALAPRDAKPRTDAAAKANGPPSSMHDSFVVGTDVGKENIAPPGVQVLKVRAESSLLLLRELDPLFRATIRASAAPMPRSRAGDSTLFSARRFLRASAAPTPRSRAGGQAGRLAGMRAGGVDAPAAA